MEINKLLDIFRSKTFLVIMLAVFSLALLCASFSVGVAIGSHKANYSAKWGENYAKNFGGPRQIIDD